MPGHSPAKTGVNALSLPGIHIAVLQNAVLRTAMPGHDESGNFGD
jgi:hypothetical protein